VPIYGSKIKYGAKKKEMKRAWDETTSIADISTLRLSASWYQ